jgi:Protein of unknown function (DUF3150)
MTHSGFDIARAGVLCRLRISQWTGRKADTKAGEETAERHSAEKQMVSVQKTLIDPKALDPIKKVANEARTFHYESTLSWEKGQQFLPTRKAVEYAEAMQDYRLRFERLCEEFFEAYPRHVAAARLKLGTLYRERDYPDNRRIRKLFRLEPFYEPIPEESHFIADLTGDMLREMRRKLESENLQREACMRRELWERLYKPVSHMAERLAEPDPTFRNTLITNIREVVEQMAGLNVFNDPALEDMARHLGKTLASLDPDALRNSSEMREAAATTARKAVAKIDRAMSAFMAAGVNDQAA